LGRGLNFVDGKNILQNGKECGILYKEVSFMCSKSQLQEILSKIYAKMRNIFEDKLKQVILYGSYARGDYEDYSDIDIMVLVDMNKHELVQYRDSVWDFAEDVEGEYGYEIVLSLKLQDVETFDKWGDILPYYKNVRQEGVSVNG
jgi:predicted nucleotidyltransferase